MADLNLRFHRDMLVLSAPVAFALERQGVNMDEDAEYMALMEPETMRDALRLQAMAGAQCLVANTEGLCEARLAHKRMEDRAPELAAAALEGALECRPQHIVCEIGPSGLPLDPSSEASVEQNTAQYERSVRVLLAASDQLLGANAVPGEVCFDAVLLNGMRSLCDLRCAIAGARRAFAGPLFAALEAHDGLIAGEAPDQALAAFEGADVVGISSGEAPEALCALVRAMAQATDKPILVQVNVREATPLQKKRASLGAPLPENPYAVPDFLADAALALRAAGAQFLRATGQATPACTGALAVAATGADCLR